MATIGNPKQRTDRKTQVTTRSYDTLGRLHQMLYADTSIVTYGSDSGNRLTTITDAPTNRTITRTYDNLDRLLTETTPEGTITYVRCRGSARDDDCAGPTTRHVWVR